MFALSTPSPRFRRLAQALLVGPVTAGVLALGAIVPATAGAAPPPLTRQTRELRPIDAVCVIDDSGSEFGPDGTDPFALRYRACKLAASYLSATATAGLDHRFGVVSFGTGAVARTPHLLALPGDLGAVDQALEHPTDLGDTNYAAGMQAATRLLGRPQAGRRQIVLVMGDGNPDVPGRSQDQAFADIRAAVAASSADVLVFQADPAGRAPDLESRWAEQGVDSVQRVASLRDGSLERAYIDTLRRAIGMDRGDELHLSNGRPSATVDVPNYLEAMTLTWFAPGDAVIRVTPAGGGRRVTLRRAAVGTRSFALPHGGRWQVELAQGAGALVAVDLVPVAAEVRSPGEAAPLGRNLLVEATFATTAGRAVADIADDPRYFGAVVTDPRGHTSEVELRRDERGRYVAARPVRLDRSGRWTVALVMKSRDGNVVGRAGGPFDVTTTPWLSLDERTVRSRQDLEVPITLHRGDRRASARDVLGEDPQAAVVASVVGADGSVREIVRARWEGGSRFVAHFHRTPTDGERTWVRAELASRTEAGAAVTDSVEAAVTAHPSRGAVWGDRARTVRNLFLLAVLASIVGYAIWLARRPALHARVDLSAHHLGTNVSLEGGRWRLVDGRGRHARWVWSTRDGTVHLGEAPIPWPFRTTVVPQVRQASVRRTPPRARVGAGTGV